MIPNQALSFPEVALLVPTLLYVGISIQVAIAIGKIMVNILLVSPYIPTFPFRTNDGFTELAR